MWKTLGGRCLYRANNGVEVHQNLFYRWLTFGGTDIHTLIHRRSPHKPGLNYIQQLAFAARLVPGDTCLLGLGGAGVAHCLLPYLGGYSLLAVENSVEIIHIASTYFMTASLKSFAVYHQDASKFVKQKKQQYSHLLVDLFGKYSFPAECNNRAFFINCKKRLLPGGILSVNLTNIWQQRDIFDHLQTIFPQCTLCLPVIGTSNLVVLACNSPSIYTLLRRFKDSPYLKKLAWDTHWGYIAEIASSF